MTIKSVETLRLEEFPNLTWVIIEDEDGVRGLGETHLGAAAVEADIHDRCAPLLLGQEPQPEPMRGRLRPYIGFQAAGAEMRANSAIDIALWDLMGKRLGVPVWALLGGRCREAIRAYNTCAGYRYIRSAAGQRTSNWGVGEAEGPYEDLDAFLTDAGRLAESLADEGFGAMKIWPFDAYAERTEGQMITPAELAEGADPFAKIRKAVPQMQVMAEMHGLWSAPMAVEIARAIAGHEIFWFEDPIRMSNPAAIADVRAQIPMKLTASEMFATRQRFAALIAARAVDVVMLDVGWCGGLTEAKAVASMAEAASLPVAPHDCTGPVVWTASCHLSVNAPNAMIQECVRAFFTGWYRELVTDLPEVERGMVAPPVGPGLGLELSPTVFDRADAVVRRSA